MTDNRSQGEAIFPLTEQRLRAERLQLAARIMAGFAGNPAIFAQNDQCGWSLLNCKDCELAGYAVKLANELMIANDAIGVGGIKP